MPLSTAVLAPLLLLATGALAAQACCCCGLVLFTLGNVVCALAPSLPVLLVGRVLMGLGAVFTPMAAGIAVALVEPARRGQALALRLPGHEPEPTWSGCRSAPGSVLPTAGTHRSGCGRRGLLSAWRWPRCWRGVPADIDGARRELCGPRRAAGAAATCWPCCC